MRNYLQLGWRALAVLGVLTLATACSDGGGGDSRKTVEPTASATQLGARAALTGFDCQPDDAGSWSAKGTLSNDDHSKVTYVVRISVAGKDSHVVASAIKNVTVDATSQSALEIVDFGKASAKGLHCSAHVTRPTS
jgi:hypothetical protein